MRSSQTTDGRTNRQNTSEERKMKEEERQMHEAWLAREDEEDPEEDGRSRWDEEL